MPNIYRILEEDHRLLKDLAARVASGPEDADFDSQARQRLFDHLVVAASRHEAAEGIVFWPLVRKRVADGDVLCEKGLAQERDLRFVLDSMRFAADESSLREQARDLSAAVVSHVAFEESEAWPALSGCTSRLGRLLLGLQFSLARRLAPTRPHPRGPYSRLGWLTRGAVATTVDRAKNRLTGRRSSFAEPSTLASWPDPIAVLSSQHAEINSVLDGIDREGHPDPGRLRQFVRSVSVHDAIERQHVYPLLRQRFPDGNGLYQHWLTEHGQFARDLAEIDRHPENDGYRCEILGRMAPVLRAHMTHEDDELLPALKAHMAEEELRELGKSLAESMSSAPTRPHAHVAGTGRGARLAHAILGPLDRARDRRAKPREFDAHRGRTSDRGA